MGQRRMGKRRMGGGRTGVCSGQVTSFSISRWPHCGGDLADFVGGEALTTRQSTPSLVGGFRRGYMLLGRNAS